MYIDNFGKTLVESGAARVTFLVNGVPSRIYFHQGRYYVAAPSGSSFVIRVLNITDRRAEFVVTVDGRDVQENKPGSLKNDGLVIRQGGSYDFAGYRLDQGHVDPFIVTDWRRTVEQKATGDDVNRGVIGVAVFAERVIPVWRPNPAPFQYGGAFDNLAKGGSLESATRGGSHAGMSNAGYAKEDRVGSTQFTRASELPNALFEVRYDTPEQLRWLGIVLEGDVDESPNPFPADGSKKTGYDSLLR